MPFLKSIYHLPRPAIRHWRMRTAWHCIFTIHWRQRRHGFTLIELLIAIGIIAVITSAAYVNFNAAQDSARDGRRKEDLKALKSALVSYYQDKGLYPPPAGAGQKAQYASDSQNTPWIPNLTANYIKKLPKDPGQTGSQTGCAGTQKVYCYIVAADRATFVLWAQLDRKNDPDAVGQPQATCTLTTPTGSLFNYCLEAPQ